MSLAFDVDKMYSVDEFCEIISKKRSTVYKLLKSGDVKAVKLGGSTRIPRSAVREYLNSAQPIELGAFRAPPGSFGR
jgi:excisionase family DNA binding protein